MKVERSFLRKIFWSKKKERQNNPTLGHYPHLLKSAAQGNFRV